MPLACDVTNSQRVHEVIDEVVKAWGGFRYSLTTRELPATDWSCG